MSRYLGSTGAAGQSMLLQIADEEKGALWKPTFGYGYHNRGPQAVAWHWEERERWPPSGMLSGDPSSPLVMFGQDKADRALYEPWDLGLGGHNSPYYLTGTCKDNSDNPLGGAIVQAFVTSTDAFVSQIACDDRGVFQVPCQAAVAHYLVAYYPGSPDKAGSSVNTLVPTRG